MPEGKPEELRCKTLDRDYTKEIQPFCPDASKVMRLGDDSCRRRRAHIHSMSRDLADKMIHPPTKAPLKKKNKSISYIREKEKEDDGDGDDESCRQIVRCPRI